MLRDFYQITRYLPTEVILAVGLLVSLGATSIFIWPIQLDDALLLFGFLVAYIAGSMVLMRSEKRAVRDSDMLKRTTIKSTDALRRSLAARLNKLSQRTENDLRGFVEQVRADQESFQRELNEGLGQLSESLLSISTAQANQRADSDRQLSNLLGQLSSLGEAYDSSLIDIRTFMESRYVEIQRASAEQTASLLSGAEAHSDQLERLSDSLGSARIALTDTQSELAKAFGELSRKGDASDNALSEVRQEFLEQIISLQAAIGETRGQLHSQSERALEQIVKRSELEQVALSEVRQEIAAEIVSLETAVNKSKAELAVSLQETTEHLSARGEAGEATLLRVREDVVDQIGSLQTAIDETKGQLISSSNETLEQLSIRAEADEATLSRIRQELMGEIASLQQAIDDSRSHLTSTVTSLSEASELGLTSAYSERAAEIEEQIRIEVNRAVDAIESESRETQVRLVELSDKVPKQLSAEINSVLDGVKKGVQGDAARIGDQYDDIKKAVLSVRRRHDALVNDTKVILRQINLMNSKESWQSMVLRQSLRVPTVSKPFDLADLNANEDMVRIVNGITDDVEHRMIGRYAGTRSTRQAHLIPAWVASLAQPNEPKYAHVEIGSLFGGSLVSRLKLLERIGRSRQSVIAIDPLEGYYRQGADPVTGLPVDEATLRENLDRFECLQDTLVLIKDLSTNDEVVEAVRQYKVLSLFIDGDHSYEVVRSDWEKYSPFVVPGGYVIMDDYGTFTWPGVIRFVNEALENETFDGWNVHGLFGDAVILQRQQ